jgi:hypothetical protein
MRILFITLIIAISFDTAKADCLACWELRKVEITLNTGDKITGFVKWNEAWLNGEMLKWQNKFPESLVPYYNSLNYKLEILVIKELIPVNNDSLTKLLDKDLKLIATKKENLIKLDHKQIKSVIEFDKSTIHLQGAGDISVFTQDEFDKLNTNPYAIRQIDNLPTCVIYFLSYNAKITNKQMKEINEYNCWKLSKDYAKQGVIMIVINGD